MARIRYIKPEFSFDEELAKLPAQTRLFYILSWTHMDRAGRAKDEPGRLRALVFPYEPTIDVNAILDQLDPHHIRRYESGGNRYLQVNPEAWKKHQKPHLKEADSTIPAPHKHLTSTGLSSASTIQAALLMGTGIGMGNGENNRSPSAVDFKDLADSKGIDGLLVKMPLWSKEYAGLPVADVPVEYCDWALNKWDRRDSLSNKVRGALRQRIADKKSEMTPAQRARE